MQAVVPALRVRSYPASMAFYVKLGFDELWTHQFEPGFPIFAAIARGDMQIFLTEHSGDCAFGAKVHFYVPDVDACHAEFQARDTQIAEPPGNSLGPAIRDMLVVDPDGNKLVFLTLA